jgi:hypothetical protein
MNDSECDEAYRQLAGLMVDQQMGWVVQEVEERIIKGEQESLDEISGEDHEQLTLFDGFNAAQGTSVAQKRLLMLIDEIYHAVVHPAECQHFLFRYLHRKEIHEINFLSSDGGGRRLVLEKGSVRERFSAAKQLGHVLQSLRAAVVQEA